MVTPMRIVAVAAILIGVLACGFSPLRAAQEKPEPSAAGTAASQTVATYCAGCHNGVMRSPSGVLLDQFDPARISENRDAWTRAYRQIQAGTMPPVGAARPDRQTYDALLTSIEAGLGAKEERRQGVPVDRAAPSPGASGQEIAARLARLLWSGEPDTSLLDDAKSNRLTNAETLERQITRMLNDGRASALVERFFFPWLGLDQLEKANPDKAFFPDYDVALRAAMAKETELFLLSQLREDRDPIELWSANYTFLNEPLARHYGVAGVTGAEFRRVSSAPERAGLLGQGSILMVTSRHPQGTASSSSGRPENAYTSPANRALWVRRHYLGATPPMPFPGAQPVKPELPITPQTRTLPDQPCVNCHRNFFPLGYALENFDPIGRWRTRDQAGPVDASGTFVDGTPTDGVVQLRRVLLLRPDAFRTTITEQLLAYADGRPVSAARMPPDTLVRARQILHSAAPARWSTVIAGIVRTP
jgi:uncharacterized protein DUF1592/uncharacterized protein DUF1588/uncharacterized protein DUF1585